MPTPHQERMLERTRAKQFGSSFWRYRIARCPVFIWGVVARKFFEPTFPARRRGWRCGRYHFRGR